MGGGGSEEYQKFFFLSVCKHPPCRGLEIDAWVTTEGAEMKQAMFSLLV